MFDRLSRNLQKDRVGNNIFMVSLLSRETEKKTISGLLDWVGW